MMDYQYSTEVDRAVLQTSPFFSTFQTRIHKYDPTARKTSISYLAEWKAASGNLKFNHSGGQGPSGHWASLALPECLPSRLEFLTKVFDYICIEDDLIQPSGILEDKADKNLSTKSAGYSRMMLSNNPEYKKLQTLLALEAFEICEEATVSILKSIGQYWEMRRSTPWDCLSYEEYVEKRLIHSGVFLYGEMICLGMDIQLHPEDKKRALPVTKPLEVAMALSNDYFSYPVERELSQMEKEDGRLFNAVALLMSQHGICEQEARATVRKRIIEAERKHFSAFQRMEEVSTPSSDLQKYIMAFRLAVSGNNFWHATAPRYTRSDTAKIGQNASRDSVCTWLGRFIATGLGLANRN